MDLSLIVKISQDLDQSPISPLPTVSVSHSLKYSYTGDT